MLADLSAEKAEAVALCSMPGMTSRRMRELLTLFGSPRGALEGLARVPDGPRRAEREEWARLAQGEPARSLHALERSGVSVVVRGEAGYPGLLGETSDPPCALFYRGSLPPPARPAVAVIGSRKATSYGLEVARWLAGELAAGGLVVASGAATGVDSAAHLGCLGAAGFTVAVLGCGADVAYPRSSAALLDRIAGAGCVMSEYPPGTDPAKWRFPERNRIIAGLCRVLVVVEASESSGALITVDHALAEGRDVMAVPGQVGAKNSVGTNRLIKNGAPVVTTPEDVFQELGIERPAGVERPRSRPAGLAERKLTRELGRGAGRAEELAVACGLTAAEALSALTRLEVSGEVLRGHGGLYQLSL